jgi:hypothetical protein
MCVIDLDPDLDLTEDELMPGLAPAVRQHPGVAWGKADRREHDPAEASGAARPR